MKQSRLQTASLKYGYAIRTSRGMLSMASLLKMNSLISKDCFEIIELISKQSEKQAKTNFEVEKITVKRLASGKDDR